MEDWKQQLDNAYADVARAQQQHDRERAAMETTLTAFHERTVAPAFSALQAELDTHGDIVTVRCSPFDAEIKVTSAHGKVFEYAVKVRGTFPYAEIRSDTPGGHRHTGEDPFGPSLTIETLSKEDVLRHFAQRYADHLRRA